ncbi:hypothetical protein R69919_00688 [Paraburkholderia gardini]|nr:hypothetical protein R69919_00688 [Paraburkholderia gardini]
MGRPKITIPLGTRFGKLEVIGPYGMMRGHTSVVCCCDCGNVKEITCSNLRNAQSKSCGCNRVREKYQNLVGKTFGRLTVLDDSRYDGQHRMVDCTCSCGRSTNQPLYAVVDGRVVSCGCHRDAVSRERSTIHGQARKGMVSAEYKTWQEMRKRCENPKVEFYRHYGGRGIKVCDRWQDFENFFADMGSRPSADHSLDRYPDVNGNYEPENCRWATDLEQSNNRRNTPFIEYQGRTQSISDWARELGVKYYSLRNRIVNLGWPVEKAFLTPFELGRNQFS